MAGRATTLSDDSTIHIVCATDLNYVPHLSTLLMSIEAHAGDDRLTCHILHESVGDALQEELQRTVPSMCLEWHTVPEDLAPKYATLAHISRATYLRLLMDEVIDPSVNRVIYLDADMIVTSSLRGLWQTSLSGKTCAAVEDALIEAKVFSRRHSLTPGGEYFNAGVLVLDMAKVRRQGTLKAALAALGGKSVLEYGDQDALNIALYEDWWPLDATWNFQRGFLNDDLAFWRTISHETRPLPRIVHFTEPVKPWKRGEWHPLAWLYWKYLLRSPFARRVIQAGGVGYAQIIKSRLKYSLKRPNFAGR
jgi:lipopolysaccharide biosynthesis glycosyltransferase